MSADIRALRVEVGALRKRVEMIHTSETDREDILSRLDRIANTAEGLTLDREHIVQVPVHGVAALRVWLEWPNGAHVVGSRLSFDAVEGGGILIRTQPFRSGS